MRFIRPLFLILIVWAIERFCHYQTDGFTIHRVTSELSFNPEWEVPLLPSQDMENIKTLLNQKFYYLARGAQAYAFVSADGLYIIKLFQHYRMRPPPWASIAPSSFSGPKIAKRKALLHSDFTSYKIAYEQLKEETGLLLVHLNKSNSFHQKLCLVDKLGIEHQIDLDQMEFLLQKKALLVKETLETLMHQGKIEEAKQVIDDLIALEITRCQKGIFDKDPDFLTNFGICEGKVMQIDVGRFRLDPSRRLPETMKIDLINTFDPLRKWLKVPYPQLAEHVNDAIPF